MSNVNGIYDAFLAIGIFPHAIIKTLNRLRNVQLLIHLLHGIVTITATPLQEIHNLLVGRKLANHHITVRCQITTQDEISRARRGEQTSEQPTKRFLFHTTRRGSHSHLQGRSIPVKHILVRVSQGMMRFIHHYKTRLTPLLLHFTNMTREPLNGEHPDSHLLLQFLLFFCVFQTKAIQGLLHLLHEFLSVRNQPYLPLLILFQKPFYHSSHHVGLSCTCRHLYHHRIAHFHFLPILVIECNL